MRAVPKKVLWVITAAYAALLAALSLLPSGTGLLSGWDTAISATLQNLLHVPAYAALVALIAWALGRPTLPWLGLVALACCAFGGLLECAQAMIPGRFGSVTDMLLNVAGAAASLPIVLALSRFRRDRKRDRLAGTKKGLAAASNAE